MNAYFCLRLGRYKKVWRRLAVIPKHHLSLICSPQKINLQQLVSLWKVVESNTDNNKKGPIEYNMGYDIVEDIKKTKANISLFELCNLPQQKKKLLEAFDPQPSRYQNDIQYNK